MGLWDPPDALKPTERLTSLLILLRLGDGILDQLPGQLHHLHSKKPSNF